MGYIGLLLNAPYKIDSMVWMMLMMMIFVLSVFKLFCFTDWAIRTGGQNGGAGLKMCVTKIGSSGNKTLVLGYFWV
jgi:hypothetical protein